MYLEVLEFLMMGNFKYGFSFHGLNNFPLLRAEAQAFLYSSQVYFQGS